MPTPPEEKRIEMLAIAYLASEQRKGCDIAKNLGLSEVRVARQMKVARSSGYLVTHVKFVRTPPAFPPVSDEEYQLVRNRITSRNLEESLNKLLPRRAKGRQISLRVFACEGTRDERRRRQMLAVAAAPFIRTLLQRSSTSGLTWGAMLEALVAALRELRCPAPWRSKPIEFIPLSGELLGQERARYSSSNLARDLGKVVNGREYEAPSLAMVPAFVPDQFGKYETLGVWRLIDMVEAYAEIFGCHTKMPTGQRVSRHATPKAMDLDMLLTSVGASDQPMGFGPGILLHNVSVPYRELPTLLAAEVGGVCIPKDDLTVAQKKKLAIVESSWTGLKLEHLEACAGRGTDPLSGPPGVVLLSAGKNRARAVRELVERGLVNHLIIDEILAKELESTI